MNNKKGFFLNKSIVLISMMILMIGMMSASVLGATGITVTYPNGGEALSDGKDIEWTVSGNIDTDRFDIRYSPDTGITWVPIVKTLYYTARSYTWDTTSVSDGTLYLIQIVETGSSLGEPDDVSDSVFTIDNTNPSSSASSPDYDNSGTIPVDFSASDTSGIASVSLWYRVDAGSWTDSGLSSTESSGTFDFTPVGEGTYEFYTLAVDNAGNSEVKTVKDDFTIFDITSPTIQENTLTYPNGGEILAGWEVKQITWTSGDITDNNLGDQPIKLEYYYNDDWQPIASNEANDGSYDWIVPAIDSSTVKVRITATDLAENSASDESNAVFTIDSTDPSIVSYTLDNEIISPNGDGIKDEVTIDITSTEIVDFTIQIKDAENEIAKSFTATDTDTISRAWDGVGTVSYNGGVVVDNGPYTIRVRMEDEVGNTLVDTTKTITVDTTIIYVGGGSNYQSIQEGIAAAPDGGTVNVAAGPPYTESLAINKGVTLQGAGRDVVTVTGTHTITANNVVIDGFTLDANGANSAVITINDATAIISGGTISNNKITNSNLDGIWIGGGSGGKGVNHITIEDNIITTNTRKGILFYNGGDYVAQAISYINITGNEITNSGSSGISTYGPGPNTITGNTVTGNAGNGISIKYDDGNLISGNIVTGNTAMGINMHEVTNTVVENNVISGQVTEGVITNFWGDPITVGKGSGIYVHEASTSNTIQYNDIYSNKIGILVNKEAAGDDPSDNHINYNNILNNEVFGIQNTVPITVDAENNWWGDVTGPVHTSNTYSNGNGDSVSDNVDFTPWLDDTYQIGSSFAPVTNSDTGEQFASIQAAIDDPGTDAGDTINVAAGTYTEDLTIPAGKDNLILAGADKTTTTIKGVSNVPVASWPLAVPNIDIRADGVKIHGFTIESPDYASGYYSSGIVIEGANVEIYDNNFKTAPGNDEVGDEVSQAIQTYYEGSVPGVDVSGLNIHDNTFTSLGTGSWGYEGIYVNLDAGTDSITIDNNQFSGDLLRAVTTERSNSQITNNVVITDLAPGLPGGYLGIYVGKASTQGTGTQSSVTVTGNTVKGSATGKGFLQGIRIGSSSQVDLSSISVTSNTIEGNDNGIYVRNNADGVVVNTNSILGNTVGVQNDDAALLDAENNWWGHITGPYHSTLNLWGQGDEVSDNVNFEHWSINEQHATDLIKPSITSVGLDESIVQGGAMIHVTVDVSDENGIVAVKADDNGCTNTGGNIWECDITAESAEGSHDVEVWARDNAGNEATDNSQSYEVDNSIPTITVTITDADEMYKNGDTVNLLVTTTPLESGLTVTADFYTVDNQWIDGSESVTDNNDGTYTISYSLSTDNTITDGGHYVTVKAKDVAGNEDINQKLLTLDNTAPTVDIIVTPAPGLEGSLISFSGSATDGGSGVDTTTYEWDLDGDDLYDDAIGSATSYTWNDDYVGTVGLRVKDNVGNTGFATTTVTVNNVVPTASAINDGPVNEGSLVTVTVSQTDPGADTFTYSFDWGNDGTYEIIDQVSSSAQNTWDDNGVYTVGIMVKDDNGGEGLTTTNVTVNNVAPTVTVIQPNGGEILSGTHNIEWTVADVGSIDTFTSLIEYSPDNGVTWEDVAADVVTLHGPNSYSWDTNSFSDSANALIRITTTDNDLGVGQDTSESVYAIDNTAPTITNILPTDDEYTNSMEVSFTVSDPTTGVDQSTIDVTGADGFNPMIDCTTADLGYTYNCAFTDTNNVAGSHTIEITADDLATPANTGTSTTTFTREMTITLTANPQYVEVGGVQTSTITAVLDAGVFTIPSSTVVEFTTTKGSFVPPVPTTAGTGTLTVDLISSINAGTATVELASGTNLGLVDVTFYTLGAKQIEVTSASPSITADGTSTVTITAQLKDDLGNDVTDAGVPITFTTTAGTITSSDLTDGTGKATATLQSTTDYVGDVTVTGKVGSGLSDTATVKFASPTYNDEISLPEDVWQLVSTPKLLDPSDKDSVFTGDYVTAYDVTAEAYIVPSNINPGHGYWVLNPNAAYDVDLTYKFMGNGTVPYSVELKAGWNLIGHGSVNTMLIEDSLYSINGKYSFVLGWTGTDWKLYSVSSPQEFHVMEPGQGYWVFMNEDAIYTTVGI